MAGLTIDQLGTASNLATSALIPVLRSGQSVAEAVSFQVLNASIASLALSSTISSGDVVPIVQGGVARSATMQLLGSGLTGNINTFIQSGNGAVSRTMQSKERDIVSVADFGTGQAASAAAIATGADVYYPTGTYTHTANISIGTVGQVIYGSGHQSIITKSGSFDVFTPAADNVEIKSLRFNGDETSQSTTLYWAIQTDAVANPKNVKVLDCKFSGASAGVGFRGAIKFNSSSDYGVVDNCDFERLWGSTLDCGYGVLCGAVTACHVTNCRGIGAAGRGRHMVYFSAGASDCVAAHNYATLFNEAGFQQFSQAAQPVCKRNVFAFNHAILCSQNGTSTSSSIQISGHSQDAKIIGNSIQGSGRNGISVYNFLLTDCSDTVVEGNTIGESQYYGIWFSGTKGGIVSGNKVRESSQVSAGTYSNIQIESDDVTPVVTTNVIVVGNHSDGSSFARSACAIAGANAPTGVKLQANYFPTCVTASVEVGAGITVEGDNVIGTWTPGLKFGGTNTNITTSTNRGEFVKEGRKVTLTSNTVLTSLGSGNVGIAEIYNLPFNADQQDAACSLHLVGITFNNYPQAYIATNVFQLQQINGTTGARTNLADSNFTASSQIRVTATYFV